MNQLLGIDIGTSACKVAVFDEDGKVLAQASEGYRVFYPEQGWAEQSPEDWWNAVCQCIRLVLNADAVKADQIAGIGIDGQSWSAIPMDRQGNVLDRTPIWMDTRSRFLCERVKEKLGGDDIFELAGNDFLPSYATPKLLWFKEQKPDVFARTYRFLQSNSYIAYQLTGVMSQDVSQSYAYHFFDRRKLTFDEAMARRMDLTTDLIPKLYRCDEVVGGVTKEAAALTGLKEGTPVVAGGLDAACGALGAGVYRTGQTQEQGGQAGGMSICIDQPLAHKKLILSPHVVPGLWLLQGGTVGGGGVLRWLRQEFGSNLSFDEMTAEAESIPAGSDGLLFLPYMAGERSPIWNPDAQGVLYGLSFSKSRGHVTRAMLEGVAYSLEHNLRTAKETGASFDTLYAVGGAANSRLWTQIKADVTGRTIVVPTSDTATTLGAVILAGIGCGIYRDYDEAIQRTVTITRKQEPNAEAHALYQRCMEKYLTLAERMSPIFSEFTKNEI